MNIEKITLNGYETYLYKWEVNKPKYVMQIVHGSKEHAQRYDELAKYLNTQGIEVWAIDLRGHGEHAKKLGHIDSAELVLKDIDQISLLIKQTHPQATYVLYGHSMGSFAARSYAMLYGRADKFIFSGTNNKPLPFLWVSRTLIRFMKLVKGKEKFNKFADKQSYDVFQKKFKANGHWVTSDVTKALEAQNDPLFGIPFTSESFIAMFEWMIFMGKKKNIRKHPNKPTLFVVGSDDVINSRGKEVAKVSLRYKKYFRDNIHFHMFDNMRHEIHNETKRIEVYKYYADFIKGDK